MTEKVGLEEQEISGEQHYVSSDSIANIHHYDAKVGRTVILRQDSKVISEEDPSIAAKTRTIRDIILKAMVRKSLKKKAVKG